MTDGSSREFRQRVEQFLATHQVDDYSAARFVYSVNYSATSNRA